MKPLIRRRLHSRTVMAGCAAAVTLLVVNGPAAPVSASHGAFNQSVGVYRIPYANGEDVEIFNDHHTHDPVKRIDMGVDFGTSIVASVSGIIRGIVDIHGTSPGAGNGLDIDGNPQVPNNLYEEDEEYEANPCNNLPPLANAGGPYFVDEGSRISS